MAASDRRGRPRRRRPRTSPLLLLLLSLLSVPPLVRSQTWESSNDPDGLCLPSRTGYVATLDCRGYVYCDVGYLMGGGAAGGVIACWPNQLFDEVAGACRSWQDVDVAGRCPDFDDSMMMPEDVDENANPDRFFVSSSFLAFSMVCTPRPSFFVGVAGRAGSKREIERERISHLAVDRRVGLASPSSLREGCFWDCRSGLFCCLGGTICFASSLLANGAPPAREQVFFLDR
ncbi:hypothetical protein ACHAWF_001435 [Thalassiosira exigua]